MTKKQKVFPWSKLCCSQCGTEDEATRGDAADIDVRRWLCGDCALLKPVEDENARLRAEVERLRKDVADRRFDDERLCEVHSEQMCGECCGCLLRKEDVDL